MKETPMDDEFDDFLDDGDDEPIDHVLGYGDLRQCFPQLSLACIEELADSGAVSIRIAEFGTAFDFAVGPAAKAIIARHESAAWLSEHIREACRLAMLIPTESD